MGIARQAAGNWGFRYPDLKGRYTNCSRPTKMAQAAIIRHSFGVGSAGQALEQAKVVACLKQSHLY